MQAGDILFCMGDTWLDKLIQWAQVNPYSHVVMAVNEHEVVQVAGKPIHLKPVTSYPSYHLFTCPLLTEEQREIIKNTALNLLGSPYSYRDLLSGALRYLFHYQIKNTLQKGSYDCATFVYYCYLQAGVRLTWAPIPSVADLSYSPLLVGYRQWEVI